MVLSTRLLFSLSILGQVRKSISFKLPMKIFKKSKQLHTFIFILLYKQCKHTSRLYVLKQKYSVNFTQCLIFLTNPKETCFTLNCFVPCFQLWLQVILLMLMSYDDLNSFKILKSFNEINNQLSIKFWACLAPQFFFFNYFGDVYWLMIYFWNWILKEIFGKKLGFC